MRLRAWLIAVLLIPVCTVQAQRTRYGVVKGSVLDSLSKQPVEAATISVFLQEDSSLVNFVLTNRKGEFLVKQIPLGKICHLLVTYNGLKSYSSVFSIAPDKTDTLLAPIRLGKAVKELEEVMVIGQRPPMVIKRDTIEFNAGSFKTMPNAVLEDLVRQLPGVDVDKDGNLTMNGKKINKITLDGKDFFGNDPQVALRNLPRNIIDKIQVVDDKTRQAQFNKTSTADADKVLNLTLKKDQNQGWFGRVYGGYGTEKRYEAGGNLNLFNSRKQISIITDANNTNRSSSNSGNFGISNAQSSLGAGATGFTDTKSAGLNFSNVFSKDLTMSSSYFFSQSSMENNTITKRKYILPDSSFDYYSNNSNTNHNGSHRLNLSLDYRPDSMNNFYLNASLNKSNGKNMAVNDASSLSEKGEYLNTSLNTLIGKSQSDNLSSELFWGRRFRKEGRSVSLNLNYSTDKTNSDDFNSGKLWTRKDDGSDSTNIIDQLSNTGNRNNNYGLTFSYSEPLVKDLNVLLRYSYRVTDGNSDKITNRFNDITGAYDLTDSLLTDQFVNKSVISNPDISINYLKTNRYKASAGLGLQWLRQRNNSKIREDIDQRYLNIFPTASFSWQTSRTSELSFFYNGSSQQPSPQQLQPVPDNSNPLYILMGNPDLKPAFSHNLNLSYRLTKGQLYWYGTLAYNTTTNQIVQETYFDELGRQVNRPLNINGNYNISGNGALSRTFKADGFTFRLNCNLSGGYNRNRSLIDKQLVETKNYNINGRLYVAATYKDLINFMPSYSVRFNDARYSVSRNQDASSVMHIVAGSLFVNWPKRLIIENSVQYQYNSRIAPGFSKGVTAWNAAANYQMFRNKRGMLKLAVYDILKQNTNVMRTITQNYIQDVQVQVLQQYFMVSFLYSLQSFGAGKKMQH